MPGFFDSFSGKDTGGSKGKDYGAVIEKAKKDYMAAQAKGDRAAMEKAHQIAEQARREGGISNSDPRYGNDAKTYKGDKVDKPTKFAGLDVSRDAKGNYVYTNPKDGSQFITTIGPDEVVYTGGDGMVRWNPVLQGAADARGVGLYTHSVGGRYLSTPESDARYLSNHSPMGMDYTRRHMNPWEFVGNLTRERAGEMIDWDRAGYANDYSPVPQKYRDMQDFNRSQGLSFQGYQLPQVQEPWEGLLQALMPYMSMNLYYGGGLGGGYGGINPGGMYGPLYGGFNPNPTGGYDYSGINPGGMYGGGGTMYAGGSPYFNEFTGQYDPMYALLSTVFGY